jgi:hypothetical protein
MATRKAGSRRITVDGKPYRWRIRRRATNFQADYGNGILHVAVEAAEEGGQLLVLLTDRPHPQDWGTKKVIPVTPSDVANWVRRAIEAGWTPLEGGPMFLCRVSGARLHRL